MAIAEFYESLSDAKKVHVLQNGKTIAENFPSVTDWKTYKIIVNNCWNEPTHVVCPSDSIIIRKVPLGLDPLSWILIGIGAVGLGFGIWGGIEGHKARKEAEKVIAYEKTMAALSDEELRALKKNKNKRDLYIFLAVVMVIALVGVLIYKLVKRKKVNNTVTINS